MPDATVHTVRVTLERGIYRDIELRSGASLYNLAQAILGAFGFDFDHAFGFFSNTKGDVWRSPLRYELFADMGLREGNAKSVKRTKIEEAFTEVGSRMTFLFDYGDEWEFRTEVVGIGKPEAGAKYPRVVKTVGEAPPQYGDAD
jgi:hypothetical protein